MSLSSFMKKMEQKRRFEKNDGDGEMAPLLRHLIHNLEDRSLDLSTHTTSWAFAQMPIIPDPRITEVGKFLGLGLLGETLHQRVT